LHNRLQVVNYMKYYSIGEFSDLIGRSQQTLRLWDKKNIFIPNNIT
jgi:putative resolvase